MPDFSFEREVRTPYSEAYTIREDDRPVGRIDIHFADGVPIPLAVISQKPMGCFRCFAVPSINGTRLTPSRVG